MPPRERELVDERPGNPVCSGPPDKTRHLGLRSESIGAKQIGALAIGAVAFGVLAIGALKIGQLAIGRARIRRIEIDDLVVRRLHIAEELQVPDESDAKSRR